MDLQRFQALLDDPRHGKADLVTMYENAARRSAPKHMQAAEATLNRRFPNWRVVRSRRGGRKPTDVEFRGRRMHCDSERDAYVWLLERFIEHYPKPFVEFDWETMFVARGPRALYFSKSVRRLFGEKHAHLAEERHTYCRLSNGWYAKLVLSEPQKVGLLMKFAALAQLQYGVDWDWNGHGKVNPPPSSEQLLRELEAL